MADRMIQCPECRGTRFAPIQSWNSRGICGLCIDSPGTIADRRKPTANDRAVERLLEIANAPGCSVHDYEKGRDAAWDMVGDIIREEAERG